MKRVILPNGLTILFEPKKSNAVVIEIMVKVGSNDEMPDERGISHFLEHMLFEGTKRRPTNRELTNEIEKIGGELNAYTSNERTCFYIKVLKKHFPIAVEILADIFQNSLFREKDISKEKNIVLKEIDLVNDEPRYYQWLLLQKNIFEKHPARFPTYGDKKVIQQLNREKILRYFNNYYQPKNLIVSIVGDVSDWKKMVKEKFVFSGGKTTKKSLVSEPSARKTQEIKEKRDVSNSYAVMGFKTVPRNHSDSYVLEVINGILGRGQSGRMFTEIRTNHGLAYDVGTQNLSETTYGYFAVYVCMDKKNLSLVKKLILEEIEKLKNVNEQDLNESKTYLEGDYFLELEDGQKLADQILFWHQVKDANLLKEFVSKIKKVTSKDIKRVVDKYFNHYTLAVIEGK